MFWLWAALGLFALILAGMYVPDWIKWARWNSERKRLPENRQHRMRPAPVAAPFWSTYVGPTAMGGGPGMVGGVDVDPTDDYEGGGLEGGVDGGLGGDVGDGGGGDGGGSD